MQQHKRLVVILETAIIAAFAMALTYIPHTTGVSAFWNIQLPLRWLA